ncbi:flagellar biosynthesis anti-sigma factor FlgM [Desulfosediminicola flagellatus]|uniref:flagellar biosynthesis anti-sigma factor FlgM n=1 Tax=Desulfosediminicola flagellatus TaxID=2569541 RepID=UPI0010ACD9F5|nr:flagellar biosynthesis anti-sigma factor FlgM [Desulfosediminicola flagellatus]
MSVEFFGVGGPNQIGSLKKTQKATNDKKAEGAAADKVEFSTVLQDVHKAQGAKQAGSTERANRIAELKAQIADGSYKPDLEKVASSLVEFLMQGK